MINKIRIMRRLFSVLVLVCLSATVVFGQEFIDYRSLEKKLVKSNENIANEKKALKLATWMERGELMVKIFNAYQGNLTYGMDIANFPLLMGKAQGERDEKVGNVLYHVLETSHVDYYFDGGWYAFFKITHPIVESPLVEAFNSYKKAIELDPNKKKENQITESLLQLRSSFANEGLNYTKNDNYDAAIHSFENAIAVDPYATGKKFVMDSTLYYCLAFSQAANNQSQEAFANYQRSIDLGYTMNGELLCLMASVALQDSTLLPKAYDILKQGLSQYPDQKCIMLSLIDNCVRQGRDPQEVVAYVQTALEKDPKNPFLHGILGNVYEKLNDIATAEKYYRLAYELKSDWYDMLYNIAIVHYNKAASLQTEAVNLPRHRDADYDKLMSEANTELHTCIRVLEELDSVKKDHADALDLLRQLYFRFRMEDGMQAKYDAIKLRLEGGASK